MSRPYKPPTQRSDTLARFAVCGRIGENRGIPDCLRVPMHHDTDLINIVAVGLGLAFIFGALANKLRLSPWSVTWLLASA